MKVNMEERKTLFDYWEGNRHIIVKEARCKTPEEIAEVIKNVSEVVYGILRRQAKEKAERERMEQGKAVP